MTIITCCASQSPHPLSGTTALWTGDCPQSHYWPHSTFGTLFLVWGPSEAHWLSPCQSGWPPRQSIVSRSSPCTWLLCGIPSTSSRGPSGCSGSGCVFYWPRWRTRPGEILAREDTLVANKRNRTHIWNPWCLIQKYSSLAVMTNSNLSIVTLNRYLTAN